MNTNKKWMFLLLQFALCFCAISIATGQSSSSPNSHGKTTGKTANNSSVLSKGYMTKAEFVAYIDKELDKIKDIDLDMAAEEKAKLVAGFYEELGISSIKGKPEKLSKNDFISAELAKVRKSKEYAEKSTKIEKDADKLYSVKKKGDPISVFTKTGKHYEGKYYGKTSSYITIDDYRVPLIDLSQDSLDLFSESAMSKKRADYVRREKQRLLPDTYELNELYKKEESQALRNGFKGGYILSNGEWVSVKTIAISIVNTNFQRKKKALAEEAERKRLAEEAEQRRIAEAAERKRLAEEAEQKSVADAAKWKRIAEESEAELKDRSAFYDKELEKKHYSN